MSDSIRSSMMLLRYRQFQAGIYLMATLDISYMTAMETNSILKVSWPHFLILVVFTNNPFSHNSYKDFTVLSSRLPCHTHNP